MSRYDDEPFMLWFTRPTATWLELSAAARGVGISIAMEMALTRSGSLTLRKGLSSLARVIQVPWETLEPAIAELISAGKLEWDGDRFVLFDPEYADRKRKTSADRMREKRSRDRLSSPPMPASDARDVTSVTRVTVASCDAGDAGDAPSSLVSSDLVSDLKIPEEIPSARPRPPDVANPLAPPPEWFDGVLATLHDTCGVLLPRAEAWVRYAGHRTSKSQREGRPYPPTREDAAYWLSTVMVEEARKARIAAADKREREAKWDKDREKQRDAIGAPQPYHQAYKPPPTEARASPKEQAEAMKRLTAAIGKVGS